MAKTFKLTPEAKLDVIKIGRFTEKEWGKEQRNKYLARLDTRIRNIAESPHLGRERLEIKAGYRSVREGKHVIFYRVRDTSVEILRVLHGSMDLEHRLGRRRPKDQGRER